MTSHSIPQIKENSHQTSEIEIKNICNEDGGYFDFFSQCEPAGKLTYSLKDKTFLSIDSTEVYKKFEGQGIAKKLIQAAIDYAIKNNLKIIPVCSFADVFFRKNQEYNDIIYTGK